MFATVKLNFTLAHTYNIVLFLFLLTINKQHNNETILLFKKHFVINTRSKKTR